MVVLESVNDRPELGRVDTDDVELMAWRTERQPASPDEYVFATASGRPRDKENTSRRVLGPTVKPVNELARRFGADHIVDTSAPRTMEERVDRVAELSDGGADFVLEVTGVPAAFTEALHPARRAGRIIEIGNLSEGPAHEVSMAPSLITRKALRVTGSLRYHPWYLDRALQFLQRRHASHPFDELTDREHGLHEVGEAIGQAETKQITPTAVVPGRNHAPPSHTRERPATAPLEIPLRAQKRVPARAPWRTSHSPRAQTSASNPGARRRWTALAALCGTLVVRG